MTETLASQLSDHLQHDHPWESVQDGEYAIVELFGHTTLIGRVTEVECFGAKMMAIEVLFGGKLLRPIYHGGAAIYRMTPCSRLIAWERQHKEIWTLPPTIRAVIPLELLPASSSAEPEDDENRPF